MNNLQTKKIIEVIVLILCIGLLGVFYWQTIMYLPLFGDATIHGAYAKELLQGGWKTLSADYPPFYYFIMAIFFAFLGEKGFNLVPYVGFLFLLLAIFLFIEKLTKNYYISLLSVFFVGASPKIIYYAARMYQEILISALFIFSMYLLFLYLEKKTKISLVLTLVFTSITLAMKQQGLFILYSSMVLFFTLQLLRKQLHIKEYLLVFLIPLLIGLPFYGVLFHTKGEIQPGSGEFKLFKIINGVGQKLFFYQPQNTNSNAEGVSLNFFLPKAFAQTSVSPSGLDAKLQQVSDEYSERAYSRAESRHIWPTDVLLHFDKFNEANSLYLLVWQGKLLESPILFYASFIGLLGGLLYCLFHYKEYKDLLLFTAIFLPINYILFARNNDQQRYHLFLPIYLLSFTFIFFYQIMKRLHVKLVIGIIAGFGLTIMTFFPILIPRIAINQVWANTQLYSSSRGGIASVKEMGDWIQKNTNTTAVIGQQCGNETAYYSDRTVVGDWRIYFLPLQTLKEYFKKNHISYYVIYESQLVDDKDWQHICWVPRSFYELLNKNYKQVYKSSQNDIYVYEII